jgi:hypothetical protein
MKVVGHGSVVNLREPVAMAERLRKFTETA